MQKASPSVKWEPRWAILQGASNSSTVSFSLLMEKSSFKKRKFFVFDPSQKVKTPPFRLEYNQRTFSPWGVVTLYFINLRARHSYQLLILDLGGRVLDERNFQTLDVESKALKWAVVSCIKDSSLIQKKQWRNLQSLKPDVVFMIGDNVYVDVLGQKVDEQGIWSRYVETRHRLEIFRQKNLIPIFATWDDHDYGKNNSGRDFPYKGEAQKVFQSFFPMTSLLGVTSKGPGVSHSVILSKQLFLFLDNRSFRTLPEGEEKSMGEKKNGNPGWRKNQLVSGSHFGPAQVSWILNQIRATSYPVWLISGDQFFGGHHPFESFQGQHPRDFKVFLKKLKKTKKNILFISGDRHLTEIMKIPPHFLNGKTYEITSSPIHSSTYKGSFSKYPNPFALVGVDGVNNFIIIESSRRKKGVEFKVWGYRPDLKVILNQKTPGSLKSVSDPLFINHGPQCVKSIGSDLFPTNYNLCPICICHQQVQ